MLKQLLPLLCRSLPLYKKRKCLHLFAAAEERNGSIPFFFSRPFVILLPSGYGAICICIADSLCYKAETNKPL